MCRPPDLQRDYNGAKHSPLTTGGLLLQIWYTSTYEFQRFLEFSSFLDMLFKKMSLLLTHSGLCLISGVFLNNLPLKGRCLKCHLRYFFALSLDAYREWNVCCHYNKMLFWCYVICVSLHNAANSLTFIPGRRRTPLPSYGME